jgi:hypothetical protein
MASASVARTLVALLVLSCLSGLVLANDAGTGGDAGGSTSTAAWLPAANATYYGNLTSSNDTDDYYGVNMSSDTGIAVGLTSPSGADFDLMLYSSTGSLIDSSYSTSSYDSVTSNGTNVSGTTVYIRVNQWTGSGQYTLQIWIFSTSSGGGGSGQNDANTGGDASDTQTSATPLNATNATYYGYADNSNDEYDWYSIAMPMYHSINASLSWNTSGVDLDLHLYDENGYYLDYSLNDNPENVSSGNTAVGGTTVYMMVRAWISGDDYTLTLWFDNISSAPIYNQNDSGTGGDASDDYNNPTGIITNIGQNDFTGWASSSDDVVDEYSVDVPADYGISVSVSFDTGEANFDVALALMPNPASNIIDISQTPSSPETVTSNGTYVGGETVLIEIYANTGEGDYNMTIWIFTLDTDGDGFYDEDEITCGSDPDDPSSVPQDTDADGICDVMDYDDDGDGYEDANDSFPLDDTEWEDTDNDGIGNNADEDDDGDGWTDAEEYQCGSDPLSFNSQPDDYDGDQICDPLDDDDDNDGYLDSEDAFPLDAEEWLDTDGDLIGDNEDIDDDGDGFSDAIEATCGSDPLDANSLPLDTDQDGSCNAVDGDDDNDGYADVTDAFPLDAGEWVDTDGDGTGDNSDVDDDGDGYPDSSDAFPLDSTEWEDNDGDGLGNNADLDDDNDGWSDTDESDCQSDPFSAFSTPDDFDDDHLCDDPMDDDDDGDGVDDIGDMFPFDATEWADLDLDGIGDNTDEDDDGDGWSDLEEPNCGTDPMDANSFPADFDGDRICDVVDNDDDNDMVLDINDAFQFDPAETKDTDGDGIGNNADSDDDGDDWPDNLEVLCFSSGGQGDPLIATVMPADNDDDGTCDAIDADDDNDGVLDEADVFPFDGAEWEDRNGDGLGDNGHPLTLVDKMKLNPVLTVVVFTLILAVIAGVAAFTMGRRAGRAEETWKDDEYQRYDRQPALREEESRWTDDEAPPPPPARPISAPEPEMIPEPEPDVEEPEPEPEIEVEEPEAAPPPPPAPPSPPPLPPDFVKPPPPPPPGFEGLAPPEPEGPVTVDSWEDLPDGGDYVQTEPMQYTGEDCGTWVRQPDDSWELQ